MMAIRNSITQEISQRLEHGNSKNGKDSSMGTARMEKDETDEEGKNRESMKRRKTGIIKKISPDGLSLPSKYNNNIIW